MRVLFLGNNWLGWQVAHCLNQQREEIVGLVLHPPQKRTYGDEIIASAGVDAPRILDGSRLREPESMEAVRALRADMALSVLFDYILLPEFLDMFPAGAINLHPAYLPYNRGQYPNVWSIVEGTPAGATLHYIDGGVDTGDIIAQRRVEVEPVDTGETLYRKLERACLDLFIATWPLVRAGSAPRVPQPAGGTSHRTSDVDRIDEIDLDRTYRARELIDIIRARTFPPYSGVYFRHAGCKVYLRLQLVTEGLGDEGGKR